MQITQRSDYLVNGLILAGGKSQRMGQDKGLLTYHGKTQIDYCFEILSEYVDEVFISSRKNQYALKKKNLLMIFLIISVLLVEYYQPYRWN